MVLVGSTNPSPKFQASLEETIYRHETTYLEDTTSAGNIIKGFDNYIKSSAITSAATAAGGPSGGTISGSAAGGGGGPGTARRKTVISDTDRVFSRSSTSYMRDSDSPCSATTTPNYAAGTPTGSFAQGGGGGGGGQSQHSSAAPSLKSGGEKKKKKKKKASVVAAEEESEMEGKPNKRARITYGPRE